MKHLPDIFTSVSFWASVGTLWSAAGAWFTYVASAWSTRQQNHDGLMNLVAGIEAELDLVSEWASGGEGEKGYLLSKSRAELMDEHLDWFNPSRLVFGFDTPALSALTSSPFARSVGAKLPTFVRLNHSIRRLLEYLDNSRRFALGNVVLCQSVLKKLSPKQSPSDLGSSTTPLVIFMIDPRKVSDWTEVERDYLNTIFRMNEGIHQRMIGGAEGPPGCLYLEFREAKNQLTAFKKSHQRPESLPGWYWLLHAVAVFFFLNGLVQVWRWFELWPWR
jgi:hypothetical protein